MLELHAHAQGAYGHLLFEICEEVSREAVGAGPEVQLNEVIAKSRFAHFSILNYGLISVC